MIYEFYFHPKKKIKVMVFPNGFSKGNDRRYTIQRIDNDLVKKDFPTRAACRAFLVDEKGYIREPEVTRTSNRNYSGAV